MEAPKSGVIVYNPSACAACGACELVCSLWREGIAGPALARLNIVRDAFTANHTCIICQQCPYPSCYYACPSRDTALCIDEATGARYINGDECNGCGLCVDACPFDPPRLKLNTEKQVVFKCDLCRGREEGPVCIEYCPLQALSLLSKDERL